MTKPFRLLELRASTLLAVLATCVAALLVLSATAGAIVTTVGGTEVGLQPRSTVLEDGVPASAGFANPAGNPVLPSNKTYAIYWDPTDHYHGDWQQVIDAFFHRLGGSSGSFASVFAVDAQYTDSANQHAFYKSTFMGAYTDTNSYPLSGCEDPDPLEGPDLIGPEEAGMHTPICLTDSQMRGELARFIAQHGLGTGMGSIFYLLTPPGVTVCLQGGGSNGHCSDYEATPTSYGNSFCSYHSAISPTNPLSGDSNTILYAVIPWTAGGLADGQFTFADELRPGYDCQDGGYDPSTKPIEQAEAEPHPQEPNQVSCPSPDGYCDTGLADLIVNQVAVEQQNIVTDPLLNAWQDSSRREATDECRNFFAPTSGGSAPQEGTGAGALSNQNLEGGSYYLNDAFNLAATELSYPAVPCVPGIRLQPEFTAPNEVAAGELVDFNGMESDITLNAGTAYTAGTPHPSYSTYTWNFGDGSPQVTGYAPGAPSANSPAASPCEQPWEAPCAASTFHSYQYGGTYDVTLTVQDTGENTASFTRAITVAGPPPPSSGTPGSTSSFFSSPTPGVIGAGPSGSKATPFTPVPVLTGLVESKSLKKVLKAGLTVRYNVNEQIAGSAQVMLDSATAKRFGLRGLVATGLPKGTPRSIVLGTALLVTTKAGKGTVHIKLSHSNATRLASVSKLKLTLRLFARNASRESPRATTVFSTVTLAH